MRPFRYIFDPLFVASLVAYAVNRFVLKPNFQLHFLHDHLNDLLCIPVWVPIGLFIESRLKLRSHDNPPGLAEILIPVVVWGWIFEVYLPANKLGQSWCTPDPVDITFYVLGAIAATLFWNRRPHRLDENIGAAAVELRPSDLEETTAPPPRSQSEVLGTPKSWSR